MKWVQEQTKDRLVILQIMVRLWVFNMEVIQCHLHFKIITLAFV